MCVAYLLKKFYTTLECFILHISYRITDISYFKYHILNITPSFHLKVLIKLNFILKIIWTRISQIIWTDKKFWPLKYMTDVFPQPHFSKKSHVETKRLENLPEAIGKRERPKLSQTSKFHHGHFYVTRQSWEAPHDTVNSLRREKKNFRARKWQVENVRKGRRKLDLCGLIKIKFWW